MTYGDVALTISPRPDGESVSIGVRLPHYVTAARWAMIQENARYLAAAYWMMHPPGEV